MVSGVAVVPRQVEEEQQGGELGGSDSYTTLSSYVTPSVTISVTPSVASLPLQSVVERRAGAEEISLNLSPCCKRLLSSYGGTDLSPKHGTEISPDSGAVLSPRSGAVLAPDSDAALSLGSGDALSSDNNSEISPDSGVVFSPDSSALLSPEVALTSPTNTGTYDETSLVSLSCNSASSAVSLLDNNSSGLSPLAGANRSPCAGTTLLSPDENTQLSPDIISILSPGNYTILAPGNNAILSPGNSAIMSPRDSAVTSRDSAVTSPRDSAVISPRDSAVISPRNSAIISPENSAIMSPRNSAILSPERSTVLSPANSAIYFPGNRAILIPGTDVSQPLHRVTLASPTQSSVVWSPQSGRLNPRIRETLAQSEIHLRRSQELMRSYELRCAEEYRRSCDLRELQDRHLRGVGRPQVRLHGIPLSPPSHLKTSSLPRLNEVKVRPVPEASSYQHLNRTSAATTLKPCPSLPFISHNNTCTIRSAQHARHLRKKRSVSCYLPYQNVIDNDYFNRSPSQTVLSDGKTKHGAFYKTRSLISSLPRIGRSRGSSKDSLARSSHDHIGDAVLWRRTRNLDTSNQQYGTIGRREKRRRGEFQESIGGSATTGGHRQLHPSDTATTCTLKRANTVCGSDVHNYLRNKCKRESLMSQGSEMSLKRHSKSTFDSGFESGLSDILDEILGATAYDTVFEDPAYSKSKWQNFKEKLSDTFLKNNRKVDSDNISEMSDIKTTKWNKFQKFVRVKLAKVSHQDLDMGGFEDSHWRSLEPRQFHRGTRRTQSMVKWRSSSQR